VREGIDTISVTPDSILKTVRAISRLEGEMSQEGINKA